MVGAFHQPRLVYMNLNTLKSLPDDQFASGMGEVLKSGLIRDARFYEWTINHMSEIQENNDNNDHFANDLIGKIQTKLNQIQTTQQQ